MQINYLRSLALTQKFTSADNCTVDINVIWQVVYVVCGEEAETSPAAFLIQIQIINLHQNPRS